MAFTREMASKVPEVTLYFWLIKILGTTVGETAADSLDADLGIGLIGTAALTSVFLVVALIIQFTRKQYVPWIYWLVVVLISVVGTLITDILTDDLGVPLEVSTGVFAVALAATFGIWFASERTLSIHSIRTPKREAFYWFAILFTFSLGTAAGDLIAEQVDLGYAKSAVLFGVVIAVVAAAHFGLKLNAVLAFWIAYVVTRPLGASIGDLLTQDRDEGGLGFGPTVVSIVFTIVIVALVAFLTGTKVDVLPEPSNERQPADAQTGGAVR
ncbi:COG4705 family protein [Rhodococcus qingshengii]|uniref:COG4705 family protein n=1 Tax=Rhodococcus qingshengii TaxID=334542 RepID=UPI0030D447B7